MASFLLSECLENIFLNFAKYPSSSDDGINLFTKDLYSCTLVSRHWCRISTPFLYAYPFNNNNFKKDISHFKLIRTLLNCVPQFEIKQIYTSYAQVLSENHIPFNKKNSYSNISPTFNYISFIRSFVLNELILLSRNVRHYKIIWLSAHNPDRISSEQTIRIMNHFINFICKYSNNLTMLELPIAMKYSDVINLSQFTSSISLQKKLKHIILSGTLDFFSVLYDNSNNMLNLLSTQSLQILEIKNLSINYIIDKNSLNLPKKISELMLYHCKGINNLSLWAKSLTKLKVFEITDISIPEDFLIQIFQSSSNTLIKLVININIESQVSIQIFQQIPFYLYSLNHLELPIILLSELISIFKSCIRLVYLSVILNDDVDLKDLGKFIPKTLERIWFKLLINETSFKESLRCFLEGYINNNCTLKNLEFGYYGRVESFVTYGIKITVYSPWLWNF